MGSIIKNFTGSVAATDDFHASAPSIQTQQFAPELMNSQNQVNGNIANQQGLVAALQAMANGTGPNPAQAQYQNNVNQNAQQEASAIGSQKGISPALAARLIAGNSANANQNAAGTAAVNQATQQQQALGQEAGVYNNIGSEASQNQATLQGAQANQNNAINTGQLGAQGINADASKTNASSQNAILGGLISGGAAAGAAALGPAAAAAARGGQVPGHADVSKDSIANDKVPYMLSPGEDVLPRSVTMAKNAPEKAKEFVEALIKAGPKKASTQARNGYSAVLESQRMLHDHLSRIEAMMKGAR